MPWVEFTDRFDFRPTPRSMKTYEKGAVRNVTTPCAEQAIAAGKAKEAKPQDADKAKGKNAD